nr:phytochrome A-associated F-box protein-like [Physcomitrium patens]|eukprot:XP_024390501.1 phytochrome A-associated F-box protein-like [Physcomitrella patens]
MDALRDLLNGGAHDWIEHLKLLLLVYDDIVALLWPGGRCPPHQLALLSSNRSPSILKNSLSSDSSRRISSLTYLCAWSYRRIDPACHGPPVHNVLEETHGKSEVYCYANNKGAHLAKGSWSLTREQGNKLLASRFREDSLFICDWPGCCHQGEKRVYKLFRGIFKNFKQSHVWRNLKDQGCRHTDLSCAFCASQKTFDIVTSFCLCRSFEYYEDGEPVIRAYVCENGHVAGAWTDRPLYNL